MNSNAKNLITLILIFALFFGMPIFAAYTAYLEEEGETINPNDYARIVDVDYKAVVVADENEKPKLVVTERVTFDVHAASRSNPFYELWLDLSEEENDGATLKYKVNSVKQITSTGSAIEWEESSKLYWDDYDYISPNYGPGKWHYSPGPYNNYDRQEAVFFYIDAVYRERMTFEVEYEVYNNILRYEDCGVLYIQMFESDDIDHLEHFSASISIPNELMPQDSNYQFTTYGTNSNYFEVEHSTSTNSGYHTFSFDLDENELRFKPYNKFIEFEMVTFGEDKHIFAKNAIDNDYSDENVLDEVLEEQHANKTATKRYRNIKLMGLGICIALSIMFFFIGKSAIAKTKKKYNCSDEDYSNTTYRDIPSDLDPNFAASLVFSKENKKKKDDSDVYASVLLSLARKKYISLEDCGSDVNIVLHPSQYQRTYPSFSTFDSKPETNFNGFAFNRGPIDNDGFAFNSGPIDRVSSESIDNGDSHTIKQTRQYTQYTVRTSSYGMDSQNKQQQWTQPQVDQNNVFDANDNPLTQMKNAVKSGDYNQTNPTPYKIMPDIQTPPNECPMCCAPLTENVCKYCGYEIKQQPTFNNGSVVDTPVFETSFNQQVEEPVYEELESLTISETHYLDLVKRYAVNGSIMMSALQNRISTDYSYANDFLRKMKRAVLDCGIGQKYLQKADYEFPKRHLKSTANKFTAFGIVVMLANFITYRTPIDLVFGGLFVFGIALFLTGKYIKNRAHKYVLLTQLGEDEYKKWKGLYNFLSSDTLINEKTFIELPIWEKYLIYATAFGISDKVTRAIELRCTEVMPAAKSIVYHPSCRSGRIRIRSRGFHSSVRTGSRGASFSSSYGGGRGMGGGGGH